MTTEERRPPAASSPGGSGRGYESQDLNVKGILIFCVCLVVLIAGTFPLVGYILSSLDRQNVQRERAVQIRKPPRRLPKGLRLQVDSSGDLKKYSASQARILNSYGWVDKPKGIARIPIERAMDILSKKGLPARAGKNK